MVSLADVSDSVNESRNGIGGAGSGAEIYIDSCNGAGGVVGTGTLTDVMSASLNRSFHRILY